MVLSLTVGTTSCSYHWWCSSQLHHKVLSTFVQAARLVPRCNYEICNIYDNKGINNYPLKKFGDKDQEVVVILVEACGTRQNVHSTEVFVLKRYIMWKQC